MTDISATYLDPLVLHEYATKKVDKQQNKVLALKPSWPSVHEGFSFGIRLFVCLFVEKAGPEPNEIDEGDYNVLRFSSALVGSIVETFQTSKRLI